MSGLCLKDDGHYPEERNGRSEKNWALQTEAQCEQRQTVGKFKVHIRKRKFHVKAFVSRLRWRKK